VEPLAASQCGARQAAVAVQKLTRTPAARKIVPWGSGWVLTRGGGAVAELPWYGPAHGHAVRWVSKRPATRSEWEAKAGTVSTSAHRALRHTLAVVASDLHASCAMMAV
jgi:hypothetical protein